MNPDHSRAENVLTIVDALTTRDDAAFANHGQLVAAVRTHYRFPNRTEPVFLARLLGVLEVTDRGLSLSALGRSLGTSRAQTRMDLLHFLLLTAWSPTAAGSLGVSWTYRLLCGNLWERQTVRLTTDLVRTIVADVLGAAAIQFPEAKRLSYRPDSVRGVRNWLKMLAPPVMHGDEFRRREVCSRELLLLAIGQVAREDGAAIGIDLLLTPERRAAICRICLLEPAVLDRRLDQMLPTFPHLIAPGTRAGPYGRFVRLLAEPDITSLGP